jgi:hypothetical protein
MGSRGKLTLEQDAILALADRTETAPLAEDMPKVPGFHFCPDWDFLAICDDAPEAECCTCIRAQEKPND